MQFKANKQRQMKETGNYIKYICESCGKHKYVLSNEDNEESNWIVEVMIGGKYDSKTYDFCSPVCIAKYVLDRYN